MTDVFSKDVRSRLMSRIRSKDTGPEKRVRSLMHSMGLRFRLHDTRLHGKPDVVLKKHRTAVFIHGCFWHQHQGCGKAKRPQSNREFWDMKLNRNMERDKIVENVIIQMGWSCLVIWECETKSLDSLRRRLGSIFL